MEAVFATSSSEQPIFPCNKQLKNPTNKKSATTRRHFISRTTENLAPANYNNDSSSSSTIHGGHLLLAPPLRSLSFSYPPYSHPQLNQRQQQQQPPLLPLPVPKLHNSLPPRFTAIAKPNKNIKRDHSLTPKKTKQQQQQQQQPNKKIERIKKVAVLVTDQTKVEKTSAVKDLVIASTVRLGPDPDDLPKDVSRVLLSLKGNDFGGDIALTDLEQFSGSLFALAPPPSSLPLPKFSVVRPKLSCNAEAAAGNVDAGATDGLRRLLRLR